MKLLFRLRAFWLKLISTFSLLTRHDGSDESSLVLTMPFDSSARSASMLVEITSASRLRYKLGSSGFIVGVLNATRCLVAVPRRVRSIGQPVLAFARSR